MVDIDPGIIARDVNLFKGQQALNILNLKNVKEKIRSVEQGVHELLVGSAEYSIPDLPGRDIHICAMSQLPPKPGLSLVEGRARLLHDLASIELQAMELGFRSLVEFGDEAPMDFKEQLAEVVLDEARHLGLCIEEIERLGFRWGDWPSHLGLWTCVSREDSLLERLLIVHRYLEGSGLDASDKILRRLSGTAESGVISVVKTIADEEVGHVLFGSNWFKQMSRERCVDSDDEFRRITFEVFPRLPRRLERIQNDIRKRAGFTAKEIEVLREVQLRQGTRSLW